MNAPPACPQEARLSSEKPTPAWILGLPSTAVKLFPENISSRLEASVTITSAVVVESQSKTRTTWLSVGGNFVLRFSDSSTNEFQRWKLYDEHDGLAQRTKAKLLVSGDAVWRLAYGGKISAERFDQRTQGWLATEHFNSVTRRAGAMSIPTHTEDGVTWVGAHRELFSLKNGVWTQYDEPQQVLTANDNLLTLATSQGALWVAGQQQEVFCFDTTSQRWKTYPDLNFQCESSGDTRWFISGSGAVISEQSSRLLEHETSDGMIDSVVGIIPVVEGGVLAAGCHDGQMACAWFDGFRWHRQQFKDCGAIAEPRGMFQSADKTVWISTHLDEIHGESFRGWACVRLPTASSTSSLGSMQVTLQRPPRTNLGLCYGIGQTRDGDLWFAGRRLSRYSGGNWTQADGAAPFKATIKDWLHTSADGGLWIGSRSFGLFHFDGAGWQRHSTENGLVSNRIVSITSAKTSAEDTRLWVATDKDFSVFDGRQWTNNVFPEQLTMTRETGDLRRTSDGALWINRFPYKWFEANVYGQLSEPSDVPFGTIRYLPDRRAPTTEITLVQDQVAPPGNLLVHWKGADAGHVAEDQQIQYSWRLDDEPWSLFSRETAQMLLAVPTGRHRLQVRARDSDMNVESAPATVGFTVLAPVWQRAWFQLTIAGLLAIIGGLLFYLVRLHERQAVAIERAHAEQAEELSAARLRFFTNISHEFRTPLTLILGPLEKLLANSPASNPTVNRSMLELMWRNSSRLLDLVNQLLDLRKLDAGAMQLHFGQADVVEFVRSETNAFEPLALEKNIELQFITNAPYQLTQLDHDKLRKILSNLIANAIKYTSPCGSVQVQLMLAEQHLELIVRDSGVGIPESELELIWDRFYRAASESSKSQTGTGVGLALTKELVELHEGTIEVQSHVGQGSTFRVRLPLLKLEMTNDSPIAANAVLECDSTDGMSAYARRPTISAAAGSAAARVELQGLSDGDDASAENDSSGSQRQTLLIVDDNADIRHFLRGIFSSEYQVLEAEDGEQGLAQATQFVPDLIIADVMMPNLLGTDLCRRLKQQTQTNHIPVILLTARSTPASQLEGLQSGSDDYVTKPFSVEQLTARVHNQLETRRALQEKLRREFLIEPRPIEVASTQQEFLLQAMEVVENNLRNPQLGVEFLASQLDLSRSHLLRKFKALTDRTTGEFIREARLKVAAQLLAETTLPVTEIIEETGFSDRHHFGRLFRQQFGCNPTEFRQRHQPVKSHPGD